MSQNLQNFYDELYKKNPDVFGRASLEFLKKILPGGQRRGGRALDIGSGPGLSAHYLGELGYSVDAVDLSCNSGSLGMHPNVTWYKVSITDFPITSAYNLMFMALTAHHLLTPGFIATVHKMQEHTEPGGLHIYRLFTTNSDFYRQSGGRGFYDDNTNLDDLYAAWHIDFDCRQTSQAATQIATNEVREVVFRKRSDI